MNWISLIVAAIKAFFGVKADIAEQNSEKIGGDEQALKDQGAGYASSQADAAAAADVDQRIVRQGSGANDIVPADSASLKDNPDFPRD